MSANTHSFSVNLAKKIGLNETLILQHLFFWHQRNEANQRNIIDGQVWTYNSIKAFQEIFPYLSRNVIIGTLKKLVDNGYIIEGNHNKLPFDKTKWYSISEIGLIHFLNSEIEYMKSRNDISEIQKAIPDSKTDSNNIYTHFLEKFNQITNKNLRVPDVKFKKQLSARLKEGFTIDEILKAVENCKKDKWHIENPGYLTPEFITRPDKLQRYLNYSNDLFNQKINRPTRLA